MVDHPAAATAAPATRTMRVRVQVIFMRMADSSNPSPGPPRDLCALGVWSGVVRATGRGSRGPGTCHALSAHQHLLRSGAALQVPVGASLARPTVRRLGPEAVTTVARRQVLPARE